MTIYVSILIANVCYGASCHIQTEVFGLYQNAKLARMNCLEQGESILKKKYSTKNSRVKKWTCKTNSIPRDEEFTIITWEYHNSLMKQLVECQYKDYNDDDGS